MDITHQKNVCFISSHYIYVKKDHIVIHDIAVDLSFHVITQDLSIIDTIIYDTTTHHSSIYDNFGIIIVDDIDLSSMTIEHILITLVDFMKHSSVHIDLVSSGDIIIRDNVIIGKKDLISWIDTVINLDIKFIITNIIQHLSNIFQRDSVILHYIIITNIHDIYNLHISYLDISNHNRTMVSIVDYHINQIITNFAIGSQLHEQSQLNIIHLINIASNTYYGLESNIEHFINHLESYITYHIEAYFIFDITLVIAYLNQLIMELYSTITETEIIRNVNSDETSYMDIMTFESYITVSDSDILVYHIIATVKIFNDIKETRVIIAVEGRTDI